MQVDFSQKECHVQSLCGGNMQWGVITQRVKGRWLIIRLERQAGCLTHQGSMREAEPLRALGSKILTIKMKSSLQRAYTFSSGAESGGLDVSKN